MSSSIRRYETFKLLRKSSEPSIRLVLFPFLGGNSNSFQSFVHRVQLDAEILGVTTAGHHWGSMVLPLTNIQEIAQEVAQDFLKLDAMPTIFLGYSMGALVAFETALCLQKWNTAVTPLSLILLASKSPCEYFDPKSPVWKFPDEKFVSHLAQFGAIPSVLLENPDFLFSFIPTMKADHRALDEYVPTADRWAGEMKVLRSKDDPFVTEENANRWKNYCLRECEYHVVEGNHMFLFSYREDTVKRIQTWVNEIASRHQRSQIVC